MADERIEDITAGPLDPLTAGCMFVVLDVLDTAEDPQGTAKNVLASVIATYMWNSPTLVTPDLGTPSAGVMTNCTGYPGDASLVTVGTITTGVWNGTAIEGTAIASTGEAGGSKFLREDGDGTCSWVDVPGGGDALTANPLSQFAATTSAQLFGVMTDAQGTGLLVFATSPTLTTPNIGVATATSVNKVAVTAPATSATLTIADGATLTASATASVSGTNTGDVTLAGTGTYISILGQVITVDPITESDISDLGSYITDVTGDNLSALADVTITGIASGELLKWNGSAWVNNTIAEAGVAAATHTHTESDITDLQSYLLSADIDSSAELLAIVADAVGTGLLVFNSAPTIAAPEFTTYAHFGALITSTPTGTTQTIALDDANHQKLDLGSTTGALTLTLTATAGDVRAGTIEVLQHATTPRDITFVAGTGITAGRWLGTEPTWSSDTAARRRVISYVFNGTDILVSATEEETTPTF